MPKWPIRVKLIAGLSLVIGMMLTLMGGSMFGLHAFHLSNLVLTDQLRELGASSELLRLSVKIDALRGETASERKQLHEQVVEARDALREYCEQLKGNNSRGNRPDIRDELGLAFRIDHDLTAILNDLDPSTPITPILPNTESWVREHPEQDDARGRPINLARASTI